MKRLLIASVILSLSATVARAERIEQRVTKETQEKLGLDFALLAERDRAGEVQVKLDNPHTGKLKHLLRVELWVMSEDPRKPVIVASLKPYHQGENMTRVFFRLQSGLAEKTYLSLIRESDEDPTGYQVALRGYIHDRKQINGASP